MTQQILLAVVEVPRDERVRCAAEGCGHTVFRRVHLVRIDGVTKVYGSDCFGRLFGSTPAGRAGPRYGTGAGRDLAPEERALLAENTERLIEHFEREHQAEIAEAERRRERQAAQHARLEIDWNARRQQAQRMVERAQGPTPGQVAEAENEAREALVRQFPNVDFGMPGNKGWVRMHARKILRAKADDAAS